MTRRDTRTLLPDAQEVLRFRVVAVARAFGVSRTSIEAWLTRVAHGNINSLRSKQRVGRPTRA